MAWIRTISDEEATGLLDRIFSSARERAGRVWSIVRLMSLRPRQVQASMGFYQAVMLGESGLTRAERELVATVVSALNHCHY